MTLDEQLKLCEPGFPHLKDRINNSNQLLGLCEA